MMKRYFAVIGFLVLWFTFGSFLSLLEAGQIAYLEGKVEIQTSREKLWKKAEVGMPVNFGDSIRTARRSRADVILDEKNKQAIRIDEQTLVIFSSTYPGQINKLDLSEGRVYASVEQMMAGLSFEVATPSAVAGVRGTGWSVDTNNRRDEISVYDGVISLKAYDREGNLISDIDIGEGFKTIVDRFGKASDPIKLTAEERQEGDRVIEELSGLFEEDMTQLLDEAQDSVELSENLNEEIKEGIEEKGTEQEIFEIRELEKQGEEGRNELPPGYPEEPQP